MPLRGWRRIQARRRLTCLLLLVWSANNSPAGGPRDATPQTARRVSACINRSKMVGNIGAVAGARAHAKRNGRTLTRGPLNKPVIIDGVQVVTDEHYRDYNQGKRATQLALFPPRHAQLARLPLRISQVALHPWRSLDGARPMLQWLRSGPGPRPRGHVQALPKRSVLLSCRGARWAQE